MNLRGLFAREERTRSQACRLGLEQLEARLLLDGAIDVELAPVPLPSAADTAAALPSTVSEVSVGATFYVEAWIRNADGSPNGITGGYVDISYDSSLLTGQGLSNGGIYTVFSSGTIENGAGLVDDLGGNASPGAVDLGDDEWVRLGYVEFTAASAGEVDFMVSAAVDGFARAGEGAIAWQDIEMNVPPVGLTVLPANVAPTITLDDPALGTNVAPGGVYTITWTDSDPDGNAQISLYWDMDTGSANNAPGDEGTTWGGIATGISEDDAADSYGWTVDAPAGTTFYLYGTISDGVATDDDYTATTLHVNVPPTVTLDDPPPGVTVSPGDVCTITWTDSDPDDDAQISLYWDTDTSSASNTPGEEGATWGAIAAGISEDDATDSYDWTVGAPEGASYYLLGIIDDGQATDEDYTATTLRVNAPPAITAAEIPPGTERHPGETYTVAWTDSDPDDNAQITLQWDVDTDPANNSPGDEGTTWGTIATGIGEADPADSYDWQVDAPAPGQYHLWFSITDGYATDSDVTANTIEVVESVAVLATHTYNDGVVVRLYDIDPGNGVPSSDIVAWSWGEFGWGRTDVVVDAGFLGDQLINLIMLFGDGTDTADLGIEVTGNAGLASLIDARTNPQPLGFLASDGYVGTVSLGAGITGAVLDSGQSPTAIFSDDYVRTVIAKGDVDGDLVVGGNLTLLQVLGGDLNGDVTLTGSNVGTVMAIAIGGQGGSVAGDIVTPGGNVTTVMAIGGGISGSIQASTGKVGSVMAINGAITSPTIHGQAGVNLVQAINGGVASSITSGASLGTVMAINGDLDLSGGRSISAGSTVNALMAINGDILGDGVTSPDIYVGNGSLWSLLAVGGGMQSVWVDVNGAGPSSGRLSSVYVGGSVSNSFFETGGPLSSLFAQGDFTNSSVQAGSLSVVYVGGTISEDSSDGDEDEIHADTGSYFVIDSTKFAQITSVVSDTFSGVAASSG